MMKKFWLVGIAAISLSGMGNAAEKTTLKNDLEKQNYSAGIDMGRQIQSVLNAQHVKIEKDPFLLGVMDGFLHKTPQLSDEELKKHLMAFGELQKESQETEFKNAIKARQTDIMATKGLFVQGSKDPDVRIVEFFDYNCPHCKKVAEVMDQLLEQDPDVQVVYRQFPILGQNSLSAAKAALAADRQGKSLALHQALLKHQGPVDDAVIEKIAQDVGLDMKKFNQDIVDPNLIMTIRNSHQLAEQIQLNVAPGIFVAAITSKGKLGKEKYGEISAKTGEVSLDEFKAWLQEVRAQKETINKK